MTDVFQAGTIPVGQTQVDVSVATTRLPATLHLHSAAGGREIRVFFNDTDTYVPTIDVTNASFVVVFLNAPALKVRFTGVAGDTFSVRSQAS